MTKFLLVDIYRSDSLKLVFSAHSRARCFKMSLLTANLVWPWLYRGESLDNLDASSSWRSSWTPRSNSYVPNYNQPPSAFSGSAVNYGGGSGVQRTSTLPSSFSMGHLQGRAGTPSSLSSQQSRLPSRLSPTRSPEPRNNAEDSLQRNRYNLNAALLNKPTKLPLTSQWCSDWNPVVLVL